MPSKYTIREARRKAGFSVPQIAEEMGVSVSSAWNWDRGKSRPSRERAVRLAEILGIDPALLTEATGASRETEEAGQFLTGKEILAEAKAQLARKLGIPEAAFEIIVQIKQ